MENKFKEALEAEAEKEARLHFRPIFSKDAYTACVCCFKAGAEFRKGWIEANVVSSDADERAEHWKGEAEHWHSEAHRLADIINALPVANLQKRK